MEGIGQKQRVILYRITCTLVFLLKQPTQFRCMHKFLLKLLFAALVFSSPTWAQTTADASNWCWQTLVDIAVGLFTSALGFVLAILFLRPRLALSKQIAEGETDEKGRRIFRVGIRNARRLRNSVDITLHAELRVPKDDGSHSISKLPLHLSWAPRVEKYRLARLEWWQPEFVSRLQGQFGQDSSAPRDIGAILRANPDAEVRLYVFGTDSLFGTRHLFVQSYRGDSVVIGTMNEMLEIGPLDQIPSAAAND